MANIPSLHVTFAATDKVSPILKAIASQANKTKNALKSLKKDIEGIGTSTTKVKNNVNNLNTSFTKLNKSAETFVNTAKEINTITIRLEDARVQALNTYKSFDELAKRVYTFDELTKKVYSTGDSFQNLRQMGLIASDTLRDKFDSISTKVEAMGSNIANTVSSSMNKAGEAVKNFGSRTKEFLAKNTSIPEFVNGIKNVPTKISETLTKAKDTVKEFGEFSKNEFINIGKGIDERIPFIRNSINKIGSAFNTTKSNIKEFSEFSVNEFKNIPSSIDQTFPLIRNTANKIGEVFTNSKNRVVSDVKQIGYSLSSGFKEIVQEVDQNLPFIRKSVENVGSAFTTIKSKVSNVAQSVGSTISSMGSMISNGFRAAFTNVPQQIERINQSVANFKAYFQTIGPAVYNVIQPISQFVQTTTSGFTKTASVVAQAGSKFVSFGANVANFMLKITGIKTVTTGLWNTIKNVTSSLTGMGNGIKNSTNNMNSMGKSANSLKSKFQALTTSVGTFIKVAVGMRIIRSILSAITGSVTTAINRLDTFDAFDRKMKLITGSAEQAKWALDKMNEATVGTPYLLDSAASALQNFVTRGMSTEKAADSVQTWMDVVSAYGKGTDEEFQTVTDAIAKMRTKGTVEMKQLNRLFNVGINPVQTYAKAVGRSAQDVQDDLSNKKITAQEFLDVVEKAYMEGTNGVTAVAGSARNAATTWAATLNNMKAALGRGMMEIIKSINTLFGVFNGQEEGLKYTIKQFGVVGEKTMKGVAGAITTVANTLMGVRKMFEYANESAKNFAGYFNLEERIESFNETVGGAIERFKKSFNDDVFKNFTVGLVKTAILFNNLKAVIITNAKTVVKSFIDMFSPLAHFVVKIGPEVLNTIISIARAIVSIAGSITTSLADALKTVFGDLNQNPDGTIGFLQNIQSFMNGIFVGAEKLKKVLTPVFTNFFMVTKNLVGLMGQVFESLMGIASVVIPPLFDTAVLFIDIFLTKLNELFTALRNSKIFQYLRDTFAILANGVKNVFTWLLNIVKINVGNPFEELVSSVEFVLEKIKQVATSLFVTSGVVDILKNTVEVAFNAIINTAKIVYHNAIKPILEAFGDLVVAFVDNVIPVLAQVASNLYIIAVTVGSQVINFLSTLAGIVLPPVLTALKVVFEWIGKHKDLVIGALTGILTAILAYKAITVIVQVINAVKLAFIGLQAVISAGLAVNAVINPLMWIVIVIGVVVAACVWAYNEFEWFRDKVNEIFGAIALFFQYLWTNIKQFFIDFRTAWDDICYRFTEWKNKWDNFWQGLYDKYFKWMDPVVDAWNNFVDSIGWMFGYKRINIKTESQKEKDRQKIKEDAINRAKDRREKAQENNKSNDFWDIQSQGDADNWVNDYMKDVKDNIMQSQDFADQIFGQSEDIADAVTGIGEAATYAGDDYEDAADVIADANDSIADSANNAADATKSLNDTTLDKLKDQYGDLADFYNNVGNYFAENFPERTILQDGTMADLQNFQNNLDYQMQVLDAKTQAKKEAEESLSSAAETASESISTSADQANADTSDNLLSQMDNAKQQLTTESASLASDITNAITSGFNNGLNEGFSQANAIVGENVNNLTNYTVGLIQEGSSQIFSITTELLNNIESAIDQSSTNITDKVQYLTYTIMQIEDSLQKDSISKTQETVKSIAQTIYDNAYLVFDAATYLRDGFLLSLFGFGNNLNTPLVENNNNNKKSLLDNTKSNQIMGNYTPNRIINDSTANKLMQGESTQTLPSSKDYISMTGGGSGNNLTDNRSITVNPTYNVQNNAQAQTINDDLEKRLHKVLQSDLATKAFT